MLLTVVMLLVTSIGAFTFLDLEQTSQKIADENLANIEAQEFINYKNIVKTTLEKSPTPAIPGPILDSNLHIPAGYRLPNFERGATITGGGPDSWVVVWARQDGRFFDDVYTNAEHSAQVCQVDALNDCISARYSTPIVRSSNMPTTLQQGDTVYAWKQ